MEGWYMAAQSLGREGRLYLLQTNEELFSPESIFGMWQIVSLPELTFASALIHFLSLIKFRFLV